MSGKQREEEEGQSRKSITLAREKPHGGGTPAAGAATIQTVADSDHGGH